MIVTDLFDQACDKLGQAVRTQLVDSLYADLLEVVRFSRVKPATSCVRTVVSSC